jgi:hypothetical protein
MLGAAYNPCVTGGNDAAMFINDDSSPISSPAGSLLGAPQRYIKEVSMPICPHH